MGVARGALLFWLGLAFGVRVLRYDPSIRQLPNPFGCDRFSSSIVLSVFTVFGHISGTQMFPSIPYCVRESAHSSEKVDIVECVDGLANCPLNWHILFGQLSIELSHYLD